MHPIDILERYWKHTSFRPFQEEIITSVIEKEDTFALLPTGSGKSICYQIPALYLEGLCIVISPLIALMENQVADLKRRGIKAIALTSGLRYKDLDIALDNAIYGKYKFLYLSPERLEQTLVRQRIQQMKVSFIAVDEAHCISQWGYDFRPAYLNIKSLRDWHPNANCIALTATAKPAIIEDITKALDFIDTKIFTSSFKRNNIALNVLSAEDKFYQLTTALDQSLSSSIIYVRTRKEAQTLSQQLNEKGYSSQFFHGGLNREEKSKHLENWLYNRTTTMVATTAFGMGIDKGDVDLVVHYNLPESIESYYQEVGRAGRNGLSSRALLLHKPIDKKRLKQQFIDNLPSVKDLKYVYLKLCNYFQVAYGEKVDTTFQFNFQSFCSAYQLKGQLAYNCFDILDRNSIISVNQRFNFKTQLKFIVDNTVLFTYMERHPQFDLIIKSILRSYGGVFDYETKIDLPFISRKTKIKESEVVKILQQLESDHIIELHLANSDAEITFIKPREDDLTINPYAPIINQQIDVKKNNIAAVLHYIENNQTCKQAQILKYFGEKPSSPCGICSVCSNSKSKISNTVNLEEAIKELISNNSLSSRQIADQLKADPATLLLTLQELLEANKISITSTNKYIWKSQRKNR